MHKTLEPHRWRQSYQSFSYHCRWPVLWYISIFLVLFSHRRYKSSWLYIFFLPKFILNNLWKILPNTCCVNKKLTAMQYHAQGTKTFRLRFSDHKGEANEGGWMENTFVPLALPSCLKDSAWVSGHLYCFSQTTVSIVLQATDIYIFSHMFYLVF